ncbi:hypothetical protein Csac_2331 [Caldicellulosiruptor saccharolyticus DSM 8903]|uniref:Uncharacterized protein n=1 Tax=Caldicellulosiruptor saccharolyticus (strain ATCC 43494 / DSM 8903 / Tp8T 6331) TaxID=351627 RepID=A4XLX4_CALS8|nr:hypothetical protein [Caldicellulosiruptor saccharolyticus]ABP67909.1 hypothetical protein Csac_2331 [Caldicellulosiruptor saccharolyticus DSM 8903]
MKLLRKSRYKRYLQHKYFVRTARAGILLLLVVFLILFLTVEFRKQFFLPEDKYMVKVLFEYDETILKLYNGKITLRIDKKIINGFYKSINYFYFKSKGFVFSLVGNN